MFPPTVALSTSTVLTIGKRDPFFIGHPEQKLICPAGVSSRPLIAHLPSHAPEVLGGEIGPTRRGDAVAVRTGVIAYEVGAGEIKSTGPSLCLVCGAVLA